MERSAKYVNRKYFQRLLTGLLVFILFLQLPFSFAVLSVSRKSVLNNINISNQTVLEQLRRNYNTFSDNISNLTASIFWRDDIQKLLYSPTIPYEDAYFVLKDLYTSFLISHPDLHSICVFNKHSQELYIITATGSFEKSAFLDFVKTQESISPLKPVLHELSISSRPDSIMVFSHFMYQFNDPSQANESFLVFNQYADQAVSTIDTFSGTSDSVPTTTYYVTEDVYLSSTPPSSEVTQAHEALIDNFRKQKETFLQSSGTYEDAVDGKNYLLTYVNATYDGGSFLLIQDYDIVFQEINTLTNRFYLITGIFTAIAILLAFFITQQLYKPIDSIYDFIAQNESNAAHNTSPKINELEIIQHAYQSTSEHNQALKAQENRYKPIALQYGISSLFLKNNTHGIEQFRRAHPNHWISTFQEGTLQVILLKPLLPSDGINHSESTDLSLLLFALQNVTEELLAPDFNYVSFHQSRDTLGIIVNPLKKDLDKQLYNTLEKVRVFMNKHFALSVAAAVSNSSSLLTLSASLQEAITCLSYTFLFGPSIIDKTQIIKNEKNPQSAYPSKWDEQIETAIANKDTEACKHVLSSIKTALCQLNVNNAIICTSALLNHIQRHLSKHPYDSTDSVSAFSLTSIYSYFSGSGTIDQCLDAIHQYICAHLATQNYERKTSNELFINTIYGLVDSSYSDINLSSQMIADHLGLSNRYLMKKFKILTGQSLNDYITSTRLKMAAKHLLDTDTAISAIAEKVGIDNLSYFYRLFKKVYGCTPKEFRENGGSELE